MQKTFWMLVAYTSSDLTSNQRKFFIISNFEQAFC